MVIPLDGHDAVIAFRVFLLALFSLDNSHHAALQQAADGAGFIHEREHIDRVSILRYRRWDKPKIVREDHACGQHLFQSKDFLLFVKRIFISATLRCLNHHLQTALFLSKGGDWDALFGCLDFDFLDNLPHPSASYCIFCPPKPRSSMADAIVSTSSKVRSLDTVA